MQNKRLFIILTTATIILLIPLVAMQFTNEVDWKILDFVVMGVLLFGTGLLCELIMRKVKSNLHRTIVCGAIVLMFFLVWAELAVGIFGSPFAGS